MLQAIQESDSVGSLINVFENRYALKLAIKDDTLSKKMMGRTNYPLPDTGTLKKTLNKHKELERVKFVESMANQVEPM